MNNRISDPVVVDLNNYLAKIDRDESRDYAIEQRTEALMTLDGGYSPAEAGNFAEAISELAADARYTNSLALMVDRVGKALDAKDGEADPHYQMLGLHLVGFLKDYWKKYAHNQAETEIDDSCPKCFGEGCRKCEAPERDE